MAALVTVTLAVQAGGIPIDWGVVRRLCSIHLLEALPALDVA